MFAGPAAAVPHFRLTDLTRLPGSAQLNARAITDTGLIAGEAFDTVTGYNQLVRLDTPPAYVPVLPGAVDTVTRGMNASGTIAATVRGFGGGNDRAALVTRLGAVELSPLAGYLAAGAYDVNDSGVVTGYALQSGGNGSAEGSTPVVANGRVQVAVVWRDGVATALSDGGGAIANSTGFAIDAAGDVAGVARLTDGALRAVSWSADGALTILSLGAGQTASVARAINDGGDIAGQAGGLGAVWRGGVRSDLIVAADLAGAATRGINDSDTVVGFATRLTGTVDDPVATTVGEFWARSGSGFVNYALDSLIVNLDGWQIGAAEAINNRGDIVGFGTAPDGSARSYLLSPTPEPAVWVSMIAGFGMIGLVQRRQKRSPSADRLL